MSFVAVRLNAVSYPVEEGEHHELAKADAKLIAIEGQTPEEIVAAAENCDALLVISASVPSSVVGRLGRCRVISRLGAGTDKIDIGEATRHGIVVANVPDFCTNEQAEHAFALLLAWARRLPFMFDAMRRGHWTARNHAGVHRVAGQTLGLVGFGLSAQAVAARAVAFGMRVMAWTRDPAKYAVAAEQSRVRLASLEQVLAEADYVSLHLPLNSETRGLINAARIGLMRPAAPLWMKRPLFRRSKSDGSAGLPSTYSTGSTCLPCRAIRRDIRSWNSTMYCSRRIAPGVRSNRQSTQKHAARGMRPTFCSAAGRGTL
jgi:D-3-phosphoglycerate dehydrogenase / 2-oxoglutarate reductase